MRRKRFRPVFDPMEPRISLSNWFSDFVDNLFGNSTDNDQPKYTAAQIAQFKARKQAAQEARQERLAEWRAAHPRPRIHRG